MSLLAQLALVSETDAMGLSELTSVAAALQKQIARDLSQFWDVQGTISAFAHLEDVQPGYWPIIVRDDIPIDAAGCHCDQDGHPIALVVYDSDWSVTASHEALEMLVDPWGNFTIAGQSLKPEQGRVEYLVEVADPIGDELYTVNGVKVSDFITPRYFDPLPTAGVQYSCKGTITAPRTLLPDGYITWHDPVAQEWWQQSLFSPGQPRTISLGPILKDACGIRAKIDSVAARRRREEGGKRPPAQPEPSMPRRVKPPWSPNEQIVAPAVIASAKAKADRWRALVDELTGKR